METPRLDQLEKNTKYSYLRKWIIQELGNEPFEFSSDDPELADLEEKVSASGSWISSKGVEGGWDYFINKTDSIKFIWTWSKADYSTKIYWLRPRDLPELVGIERSMDLLLKEF
jgi:hypothetical protein